MTWLHIGLLVAIVAVAVGAALYAAWADSLDGEMDRRWPGSRPRWTDDDDDF